MKKALLLLLLLAPLCLQAEEISLVRHAKRVVPAQKQSSYTVRVNDSLNRIFMNVYKAKPKDMPALYKAFRELNPNIKNLNIITIGQKIIMPPVNTTQISKNSQRPAATTHTYTMKRGEHLAMMLRRDYSLSDVQIFKEYLPKIKELNPDIKNLNNVYPGQNISLPEDLLNKRLSESGQIKTGSKTDVQLPQKVEEKNEKPSLTESTVVPVAPEQVKADAGVDAQKSSPAEKKEEVKNATPEAVPAITAEQPSEPKKEKASQETEPNPSENENKKADKPENTQLSLAAPKKEVDANPPKKNAETQSTPVSDKTASPVGNLFSKNRPPTSLQVPEKEKVDTKKISDEESNASYLIKNAIISAYRNMDESVRDTGVYYMPVANGNISINTEQIPVLEVSTGRKVFLDIDRKIKPEEKRIIERRFPSYKIISGSNENIETLLDKVLTASGFYSINKDGGSILVGDSEKLKIRGKWIVYKDKSRRSIFTISFLGGNSHKTPEEIKGYALKFGIEIIEIGGLEKRVGNPAEKMVSLGHNIKTLLDSFKIPYEEDREIALVSGNAVNLSFNAKVLSANIIFTDKIPDNDILSLLKQKGYTVIDGETAEISTVMRALKRVFVGPPVKLNVSGNRVNLELPGIRMDASIILESEIDKAVMDYLLKSGFKVMIW